MSKRHSIIAMAITGALLSGLAFQNCNHVHTSGTSDGPSVDTESGNAGGYSGKPYVDVGGALECPNGQKVRARIFVAGDGSGLQTVDQCVAITPRFIPSSVLQVSADKTTLSFAHRVLLDEQQFKVLLSCAYTYNTTSDSVDEQTLVAQNGLLTYAFVYRSVKSSTAYQQTSAPFAVSFGAVAGNISQSQFIGVQNASTYLRLSPFDSAAYASSNQLTTPIQYSLPLVDPSSGQSTVVQSALGTPVNCAVYR